MKTLFIIILFLMNINLSAATSSPPQNNFSLRAGLAFNQIHFKTDKIINNTENDNDDKNEVKTQSYGLTTSASYRWIDWEAAIASDVFAGNIRDTTFVNGASSLRGNGYFRLVTINPVIKYYTPFTIFNRVSVYTGIGPAWSLQTFVFKDIVSTGNFNNKKRISFENYGGGLFIGFEEILPFNEMHPTFLEVGYSYMNSYKVAVIDATNNADVVVLSERDSREFSGQYVIVRFGVTLF